MPLPKLSKLEFQIMESLWEKRECSIREIQDAFPPQKRPAYTTVQTTGNFHLFAPALSRAAAQRRLIDDILALFGGKGQQVMAHLIETGKLSLDDVKEAEKLLRSRSKEELA
jgi:BlaI family transcriptional regulator, penicillinase repressor